ncbi:UNVERIFIED_CONTAM: hypothetical protein FKN15_032900 [Acipenser sinensis]|uniref:Secreted protein n=1 Tax=Acipenser ruthenus TaxID=7906 RepID=A0A662YU89_ACIRT|nr:hypothetical protein EOD39_10123 [Acipenser ruthenus]
MILCLTIAAFFDSIAYVMNRFCSEQPAFVCTCEAGRLAQLLCITKRAASAGRCDLMLSFRRASRCQYTVLLTPTILQLQ